MPPPLLLSLTTYKMETPNNIATALGCSTSQLKAQYEKNAAGLRKMLARAQDTGRKVSGLTAANLAKMIADVESQIAKIA